MPSTAREVLYFPTIEFPDDGWLKGALCYWDKIYRIVPSAYKPNDSDEVKIAQDAGLVETISVVEADLREVAVKFEDFWGQTPIIPAGVVGFEEELIRLHPEKVDERIRPQLEALAHQIDPDGFLSLSKEVANSYMLFLAEVTSRRRGIPKITDSSDMFAVMQYFQNDGSFDEFSYRADGAELTAALTLPCLMPRDIETYPMERVISFHQSTSEGRAAFRTAVSALLDQLTGVEDKKFFESKLTEFDTQLRKANDTLSKIIESDLKEIGYGLVSVGLPMGMGVLGVIGLESDPFTPTSIGAGVSLGILATLADHLKSRRRVWSSREASYWMSLHHAFPSANGVGMKVPRFDRLFEEFIND